MRIFEAQGTAEGDGRCRCNAHVHPDVGTHAHLHPCPAASPQIDQAALTGESLPAKKLTGDVAFSGSAIKAGERHAVVYATGIRTFFGRWAAGGVSGRRW